MQTWLDDGTFPDEAIERLLRDFRAVADEIHKRRIVRGGLDFDTVEARVKLDEAGKPLEVVLRSRTDATNMIEEAMILANEVRRAPHDRRQGADGLPHPRGPGRRRALRRWPWC